jgi:hypothetical protein
MISTLSSVRVISNTHYYIYRSISTPRKTARDKKNQQAADEFIKKLYEEGKLSDDEVVAVVEPQTHVNTKKSEEEEF